MHPESVKSLYISADHLEEPSFLFCTKCSAYFKYSVPRLCNNQCKVRRRPLYIVWTMNIHRIRNAYLPRWPERTAVGRNCSMQEGHSASSSHLRSIFFTLYLMLTCTSGTACCLLLLCSDVLTDCRQCIGWKLDPAIVRTTAALTTVGTRKRISDVPWQCRTGDGALCTDAVFPWNAIPHTRVGTRHMLMRKRTDPSQDIRSIAQ